MTIADGEGGRPEQISRGRRALGAVVALVVVAGYSFLRALEDQLGRLGTPGVGNGYRPFSALRGKAPHTALWAWNDGTAALADFHPVTPQTLIRIHAGVALVVVVAAAAALVVSAELLRDRATANPPGVTIRAALGIAALVAVLAQIVESLCEVSLAAANASGRLGTDDLGRYRPWFDATGPLKMGGLGIAALLLGLIAVRTEAVRRALRAFRAAPASHKLALLTSTVFAALLADGDLGAQSEDLLRRELADAVWYRWVILAAVLGLQVVLLRSLRHLDPADAPPPKMASVRPWHIRLVGAGLLGLGLVVLLTAGGSSLLVAGAIVLGYGLIAGGRPGGGRVTPEVTAIDARLRVEAGRTQAELRQARSAIIALAGVLPSAGLAVLTGRLLTSEVATKDRWLALALVEGALLVTAAVAVLVLSGPDPTRPEPPRSPVRPAGPLLATGVVVLVVVLTWGAWSDPRLGTGLGEGVGSIAVLLFGLCLVAAAGLLGRAVSRHLRPPDRVRPAARAPVVGLGFLWMAVAVSVGGMVEPADRSPHLVRTLDRPREVIPAGACGGLESDEAEAVAAALVPEDPDPDEPAGTTRARARLCRWIVRNAGPDAPGTGSVPLVLVTASGGGVRAATWTATVMECLFLREGDRVDERCGGAGPVPSTERDAWPLVFAAGGASGGSVGLASATAQRVAPVEDEDEHAADDDWVHRLATHDHVAAVATRMALVEGPMAWTGWQPAIDRAEVLIDSWSEPFGPVADDACAAPVAPGAPPPERAADGVGAEVVGREVEEVGFVTLAHDCPDAVPALLLNGTVVATGQRFDGSPLGPLDRPGEAVFDGDPDDDDGPVPTDDAVALLDAVCSDRDVPLFDVAFASARFPLVTPSVRFPGVSKERCADGRVRAVDVVDGGYRENSGAGQILDLVQALQPSLEAYAADAPDGFRPVVPLLVEIDNGEDTADGSDGSRAGRTDAAEPVTPRSGPRQGDDLTTWSELAEPSRVAQTEWQVRSRQDPEAGALDALRAAIRELDGTPFRLALVRHPGRALPLGWSLTDPIVDDMRRVMRLCANQEQLERIWEAIDGDSANPTRCPPKGGGRRGGMG